MERALARGRPPGTASGGRAEDPGGRAACPGRGTTSAPRVTRLPPGRRSTGLDARRVASGFLAEVVDDAHRPSDGRTADGGGPCRADRRQPLHRKGGPPRNQGEVDGPVGRRTEAQASRRAWRPTSRPASTASASSSGRLTPSLEAWRPRAIATWTRHSSSRTGRTPTRTGRCTWRGPATPAPHKLQLGGETATWAYAFVQPPDLVRRAAEDAPDPGAADVPPHETGRQLPAASPSTRESTTRTSNTGQTFSRAMLVTRPGAIAPQGRDPEAVPRRLPRRAGRSSSPR